MAGSFPKYECLPDALTGMRFLQADPIRSPARAQDLLNLERWTADDVSSRVRILAPFDPLVRDRNRFSQLWGWSYRFEAYVPAAKRERGYYAMPVLWQDEVIGWANVTTTTANNSAEKNSAVKNSTVQNDRLLVQFGYHSKRPRAKAFRQQAEIEVEALAQFLGLPSEAWEIDFQS